MKLSSSFRELVARVFGKRASEIAFAPTQQDPAFQPTLQMAREEDTFPPTEFQPCRSSQRARSHGFADTEFDTSLHSSTAEDRRSAAPPAVNGMIILEL